MTDLTFSMKQRPDTEVDLSPLIPEKLNSMSLDRIRRIRLRTTDKTVAAGDLFEINGRNKSTVRFRRCRGPVSNIGLGMQSGIIDITGQAGDYLGRKMRGGKIKVAGDAGDWVASGMAGGRIDISGNVGNFLGAAGPDERFGMLNGLITVWGNAGDRAGDRMRRGQILIYKDAGDFTGSRMVAGTILVLGKAGRHTGYRMKRGTIILRSGQPYISPGFRGCGLLKMEFLRLLFKQSAKMGRRFAFFREFGPEVCRYAGDLSCEGKGEIFILQNARL